MYIATSAALSASVFGSDNEVGKLADLYFDDESWEIRYLVIDTGNWLNVKRVLIAPEAVVRTHWDHSQLHLNLTQAKIEASPTVREDRPVSRRLLESIHNYYGWTTYGMPMPTVPLESLKTTADATVAEDESDPHLRSVNEVTGYHIVAADDEVGHIDEFILDDASWDLRYLVVDTRNWLPGKRVVVDPRWTESIDWHHRKLHVDLTRDRVERSPEFDPSVPINRRYEQHLYDFYGRPHHWTA